MAYSGAFRPGERNEPVPEEEHSPPEETSAPAREGGRRGRLPFDLASLFQKTEVAGMETDDLLMALVLYLMYRESGDADLLILLGVMLLT